MIDKRTPPQDDIPTLEDMVAPGVRGRQRPPAGEDDEPFRWEGQTESYEPPREDNGEAPKSAFEVALEASIHEILDRHMARAREEIVHSVLSEVRSRVARRRP